MASGLQRGLGDWLLVVPPQAFLYRPFIFQGLSAAFLSISVNLISYVVAYGSKRSKAKASRPS